MIRSATCRRSTQSNEAIFEGQHSVTKNKLVVAQRADRHLLLSLYEQSKQICQIRVDRGGTLPGTQPSTVPLETPALQTCIVFMTKVAQDYASDKITLPQIKELKQEFEQQHPLPNAAAKRAASTPASMDGEPAPSKVVKQPAAEPAPSKVVKQPASSKVLKKPAASTRPHDCALAGVSDRATKRPRGPADAIPDGTVDELFSPSRQNTDLYTNTHD
jgi:hypothetical protein